MHKSDKRTAQVATASPQHVPHSNINPHATPKKSAPRPPSSANGHPKVSNSSQSPAASTAATKPTSSHHEALSGSSSLPSTSNSKVILPHPNLTQEMLSNGSSTRSLDNSECAGQSTALPKTVSKTELTRSLTASCLRMDTPALREAFDVFDRDRDGRITCSELQSVFLLLGHNVTPQEVHGMITHVDIDGNGTVEYPEFLRMMRDYSYQNSDCEEAELRDAFNAFDHNGDNYIDFDEIKKTMHALGEKVTDADVKAMIHEADADHDGKINFEEFKRMMSLLRAERSGSASK